MTDSAWTCTSCGRVGNVSAFCGMCGASRPVEVAVAQSVSAPTTARAAAPMASPAPTMSPTSVPSYPQSATAAEAPGIALMPGETTRLDASFSPHLILQHLRTRVLLTDRRVIVQSPHTLFGIIPMGYACGSAPLDAVDQINHGHMMRSSRVLAGLAALLFGLYLLVLPMGGGVSKLIAIVMLAVAVAMFATARVTGIFFDTGGNHLLAAAGRGKDIGTIEDTAQRVIEAIQVAHDR